MAVRCSAAWCSCPSGRGGCIGDGLDSVIFHNLCSQDRERGKSVRCVSSLGRGISEGGSGSVCVLSDFVL